MKDHDSIRNLNRISNWIVVGSLTLSALLASSANADEIRATFLDGAHQGGRGNKGQLFRPVDENGDPAFFVLTARSALDQDSPFDPFASGQIGTSYVDRKGTGVQGPNGEGSKGISGHGPWGNEELIFTFDAPIQASSVLLGLVDIDFGHRDDNEHRDDGDDGDDDDDDEHGHENGDRDIPVLWLSATGSGDWGLFIDQAEVRNAFLSGDERKTGTVDFSLLTSIDPNLQIDSLKIRETNDHILVNRLTSQVPAPGASALLGLGLMSLGRRRRRR